MQPFKEMKNYFTDSPLYQESNKPLNEPLADDVDSENEADSELEDVPTIFIMDQLQRILMILTVKTPPKMKGRVGH